MKHPKIEPMKKQTSEKQTTINEVQERREQIAAARQADGQNFWRAFAILIVLIITFTLMVTEKNVACESIFGLVGLGLIGFIAYALVVGYKNRAQ